MLSKGYKYSDDNLRSDCDWSRTTHVTSPPLTAAGFCLTLVPLSFIGGNSVLSYQDLELVDMLVVWSLDLCPVCSQGTGTGVWVLIRQQTAVQWEGVGGGGGDWYQLERMSIKIFRPGWRALVRPSPGELVMARTTPRPASTADLAALRTDRD